MHKEILPIVAGQRALGCSIDVHTSTQASFRECCCVAACDDDEEFNERFVLQLRTSQKYRDANGT